MDYHGYLIKQAYNGFDRDDERDWRQLMMQVQIDEMERRAAEEKRRRVEANKMILRLNPGMREAIEGDIAQLRETRGRGRIRRIFGESQESPWASAVVPALAGGLFGGMAGTIPHVLFSHRYSGPWLGFAGLGAGLGALGGGAIGYGRPGRQLAKLKSIGEGLERFQTYHEQLPEEGFEPGHRYGPFSEAHQELARKLVGQTPAGG